MSRIQRALEKAKELRPDQKIIDIQGTPEHGGSNGSGAEVRYSETKRIDVPEAELLRNRIIAVNDQNPAADQFKFLRTQVFQYTRPKNWNTIMVTGFGPGEGKSMVAANLAVSIARDPRQTALLVDLDFRRPCIDRLFGLDPKTVGLKSFLLDGVPLEEILLNPGIQNLTILPTGGSLLKASETLGSPKMEALLKQLKRRYKDRYIILDTPGINVCPDPLIISEYTDAIVLVARAGITTRANIVAAMERIPKEKVLCIVFNDAHSNELTGYGYLAPGHQYSANGNTG
jgi:protein-tyrosine kinase